MQVTSKCVFLSDNQVRKVESVNRPCLDTRTYYSLKCLACLAEAGGTRQAKELARLTGITPAETAKMLSLLTWGGFLASKRGAKEGFWLRVPPTEIQVKDVMAFLQPRCATESSTDSEDSILRVWHRKVGKVGQDFERLSLADLIRETHKVARPRKRASRIH
jgi:DNA-binding IscR family transcriptional regulator